MKWSALWAGLVLGLTFNAHAGDARPGTVHDAGARTDRLIVKLRAPEGKAGAFTRSTQQRLDTRAGARLKRERTTAGGAEVLRLPQALPMEQAEVMAAALEALPEVEYAEPDIVMQPLLAPDDVYYGHQWHYHEALAGVNLPEAWGITTGASEVVIAVIDTGLVRHEDLDRVLPGYDFVSPDSAGTFLRANDGDGRDPDPTDPGDWITVEESASGFFAGCRVKASGWHGTHVAGTVAANSNNGRGVAGVNWVSPVLPVRVMGKCGGYLSDVVDAMVWAAGLPVEGVPDNPHPARVLNLSLGGAATTCPAAYRSAIEAVTAQGAVVVAAAGNSGKAVSQFAPANCPGVIAVAATDRLGSRASYSNFGEEVSVSAPGGMDSAEGGFYGVWSTMNDGTTTAAQDTYRPYQGTSMAAPHVSGIVSLVLSANPALAPQDVIALVRGTARAFPADSTCDTSKCGTGIVDAGGAVAAARAAIPGEKAAPPGEVGSGAPTGGDAQPSGGGGGGGGCSVAPDARFDPLLVILLSLALSMLTRRTWCGKACGRICVSSRPSRWRRSPGACSGR